ncbi:hypothetical protein [Clostridium tagluense]|uniref:hypothetical protein n=1 Tax=Clostridium tagluense TaxID=360422 RepID=UPI001C6E1D55|nr:hypothetical protein [Clostridium tagluense]MBW9159332.1 hypothetical protein [Clostridium tagluense]WLC68245.1 hypothetical protein KTC93_24260 [Clostridium tagluense]
MATVIVKRYLVNILVNKISIQEINPKTNEAFKVGDILIAEYKIAVENGLLELAKVV